MTSVAIGAWASCVRNIDGLPLRASGTNEIIWLLTFHLPMPQVWWAWVWTMPRRCPHTCTVVMRAPNSSYELWVSPALLFHCFLLCNSSALLSSGAVSFLFICMVAISDPTSMPVLAFAASSSPLIFLLPCSGPCSPVAYLFSPSIMLPRCSRTRFVMWAIVSKSLPMTLIFATPQYLRVRTPRWHELAICGMSFGRSSHSDSVVSRAVSGYPPISMRRGFHSTLAVSLPLFARLCPRRPRTLSVGSAPRCGPPTCASAWPRFPRCR